MDAYLPAALLHLREAEIVRLCGLARAARGQEYARTERVRLAERAAGLLRASVLDGETARAVMARFADRGLDAWECSCSLPPDPSALPPAVLTPCEHVAALLYLWVREPERFRAADLSPDVRPADAPSAALASYLVAPASGETEPLALPDAQEPAVAPVRPFGDLEPDLRRLLNLLALAGGSVTEGEAERLFTRLELGGPEAALPALERLRQRGWVLAVAAAAPSSRHASAAESPAGWSIPEHLLAQLPCVLPLAPLHPFATAERAASEAISDEADAAREPAMEALPPEARLGEQRAEMGLPALLVLMTAQMVDCSAPAPAAGTQKAGARFTPDLDAALAQQWAQQLAIAPEQGRFCLGLLRLMGVLPPTVTSRAGARSSAPAQALPAISAEQAGETLLRAYRLLLARPEAEARRDLFTLWLNAHSARELVELREAGVRVGWLSQRESKHLPDIAAENRAARQFIVNLLRWAPVGRWWSFSSLVEFFWRFQPAFLRGRQQTFLRPQWWLEHLPEGEPLALDVRASWRQGEGRYIALLVRRALHWLGVVDLALDEQGRLKGFRVTPSGSRVLGAAASADGALERAEGARPLAASALPDALQFQDDGALLAPLEALGADLLETLLCWCDPCGATRQGLRFRPSAGRVAAALDAGQDLEAWLAWLEQHPPGVGLSTLVAQLRRWAALYGQVRLYESATLLEVADPALLRELEATLDLAGQFIDHALSPGLALLRPTAAGALVEEMRRRGYAPWITDDETAHRA